MDLFKTCEKCQGSGCVENPNRRKMERVGCPQCHATGVVPFARGMDSRLVEAALVLVATITDMVDSSRQPDPRDDPHW